MSRLFLNIFTAAVTTIIGIFTGRAMKRYDLEEEISRQKRKAAMAEYQYKYLISEYMGNIRLNKMKAKIKPIRRDNVEKQVDHNTKDGIEVMTRHKTERELDRIRRDEDEEEI